MGGAGARDFGALAHAAVDREVGKVREASGENLRDLDRLH
jgi:hypothetical protein